MRKLWMVLLLALVLTGCGEAPVFEEMNDVYQAVAPQPGQVMLELPEDAALLTGSDDSAALYFCDGYVLTVQTLAGGDLDRTLRGLTGFGRDQLTLLETVEDGLRRVECVWTGAGEGGDQVGRLVLLDDGNFHYGVSVMAAARVTGELRQVWDAVLETVSLVRTGS